MGKTILIGGSVLPTTTNTPTREGEVVNSVADILKIKNPYVGQKVYVKNEEKFYFVKSLKTKTIGGIPVPDAAVNEYSDLITPEAMGQGIGEAPDDGQQYVRQSKTWKPLELASFSLLNNADIFWGDVTLETSDGNIADSLLRASGEIASASGFSVSPYIEISNAKNYYYYALAIADIYASLIVYNANKEINKVIKGNDVINGKKYLLKFSKDDKYIRCTYYNNTPEFYVYSCNSVGSFDNFKQFSRYTLKQSDMLPSNLSHIETSYQDGIFGYFTGGSYVTSDYIPIENVPIYSYLMDAFASTFKLIEFYNANKEPIATIMGGKSYLVKKVVELVPPIGAMYVRYARGVYQTAYGLFTSKGNGLSEQVKEITKQDDNIYNDRPFVQLPYPIDTDLVAVEATFEDGIFGSINEGFYTTDFIEIDLSDGKNYYWKNTQNFDNIYNKLVYYDKNKNVISVVGGNQGFSNTTVILTPPFNAKYLKYATYKKVNEIYKGAPIDFRAAVKKITNESFTESANVLWLGTSIPEGATYPKVSCESNGYSCINMAYGASYLRWTGSFPTVNEYSGRSLTATIDELESTFRQSVTDGIISESLLERWKNMSYQRSVIPYIDGTNSKQVSMIVIDHGFNDRENIASMLENESSIDWDSRDRSNFVGAFNYLLDEIQRINPFIKIVIGGYFQNHYKPYYSEQICRMQELIANHYGFELFPIWKYSQINDKNVVGTSTYISEFNAKYGTSYTKMGADSDGNIISFQLYCPDKVHPHSDLTGNCNKRLNAIYTKLIRNCI